MVKNEKGIITVDTNDIDIIVQDGEKFLLDPNAEEKLQTWIDFMDFVQIMDEAIRDRLSVAMDSKRTRSIDGNRISVIKRLFGDKYVIDDPEAANLSGMTKEEVRVKVNSKEVSRYEKETGELPPGIALKNRQYRVVIQKEKE